MNKSRIKLIALLLVVLNLFTACVVYSVKMDTEKSFGKLDRMYSKAETKVQHMNDVDVLKKNFVSIIHASKESDEEFEKAVNAMSSGFVIFTLSNVILSTVLILGLREKSA